MVATYQSQGEDRLDCQIRYSDEITFVLPVNIMFVDETGKAARVVIDQPRQTKFTIQ
jgi:hypothetical protein